MSDPETASDGLVLRASGLQEASENDAAASIMYNILFILCIMSLEIDVDTKRDCPGWGVSIVGSTAHAVLRVEAVESAEEEEIIS